MRTLLTNWCLAYCFSLFFFAGAHAQEGSNNCSVQIDKGNRFAQSEQVKLTLSCTNAYQMMVSNFKDFTGGHWSSFEPGINWTLRPEDGKQTVYVRFRDQDGNDIASVSDDITLDVTPPQNCSVAFDLPGRITNSKSFLVDVKFKAKDAKYMMLSASGAFYGKKWQIFQEEILDYELTAGDDGFRYIYVKYRDVAGNISEVVSDQLMIDTQEPYGCDLIIDHDNQFTTERNRKVLVEFLARDADSMLVGTHESFEGVKWQPYQPQLTLALEGEDGKKVIYAKFKDLAGNESEIVSDNIYSDITPPTNCSITIDNGKGETSNINKIVNLSLKAEDAALMMISNFSDFKGARWQTYTPIVSKWRLYGENDGPRTVYVRYKDRAGNETDVFSAEITLNRGF